MRLTKLYTRKGDEGYTNLLDKSISKDDALVEAVGTIDELNSHIGLVLSLPIKASEINDYLTKIQHELFDLGGELHFPDKKAITAEKISYMEKMLDQWNETLPPLKEFLLPGGTPQSAVCHIARTVCRRAERCLVKAHRDKPLTNPELLRYLNRLSDLLFVIARLLGKENGTLEIMWDHSKSKK